MAKNVYDLPTERLASLTKQGDRIFIHPAKVNGRFKKARNYVHAVLVVIFLALPWITINGLPAILLNLSERRFVFFGLTFWAHDGPLVFFVLAMLTLVLSFATALWGRVWCGWACPQTVFIENVFRRVEEWIEGNHIQRRKLDQESLTINKITKRTAKWSLFLIITLVITHSFLAYFIGGDKVLEIIWQAPTENWGSFLVMLTTTGILLLDFGWFREQFCIIACPYGRFQSVLMDENTVNVTYDHTRGEPRKGSVKGDQTQGDCINCFKCVAVCPTGIDIRRGLQMECIACTACIDACDEVMDKIKKPRGLIRYTSERALNRNFSNIWRPRTFVYLGLLVVLIGGFLVSLALRQELYIAVVRGQGAPYREISSGGEASAIVNQFSAHFQNQSSKAKAIEIMAQTSLGEQIQVITPTNPLPITAGNDIRVPIFLQISREDLVLLKDSNVFIIFREVGMSEALQKDKVSFLRPRGP